MPYALATHLPASTIHWLAFGALVVLLLVIDLVVLHRRDHAPSIREAAWVSVAWIAVGLLFGGVVLWWGFAAGLGSDPGLRYLSGYLIEKSLSVDNLFVFVVIFRYFGVPRTYQYRVLFWGILGAVVLRLVFILAGIQLIERFDWVAPLFGAFLVYTGYRLARHSPEDEIDPGHNPLLKLARKRLRVAQGDHRVHGGHFFAREAGRLVVTPLFLVLLVVESTDVVFAVDSVPAIIAVTRDPFIAFTSNVFAILGLRALYFLLAGMVEAFRHLHYGLAAVLGFVGLKMVGEWWAKRHGVEHLMPPWVSLVVIAVLLGVSIAASVAAARRSPPAGGSGPSAP